MLAAAAAAYLRACLWGTGQLLLARLDFPIHHTASSPLLSIIPLARLILHPSYCTLQVRCRDFKPMLSMQPGLRDLVNARALQTLSDHMQHYPHMWSNKGLRVRSSLWRGVLSRVSVWGHLVVMR